MGLAILALYIGMLLVQYWWLTFPIIIAGVWQIAKWVCKLFKALFKWK